MSQINLHDSATTSDGDPGVGVVLRKGKTIEQEQDAVFSYDWFRVPPTGTFRRIWDAYGTV